MKPFKSLILAGSLLLSSPLIAFSTTPIIDAHTTYLSFHIANGDEERPLTEKEKETYNIIRNFLVEADPLDYNLPYHSIAEAKQNGLEIPKEIDNLSKQIARQYTVLEKMDHWLLLRELRTGKEIAYLGFDLFEFNLLELDLVQFKNQQAGEEFFLKHNLSIRPWDFGWLGLYRGNEVIGRLKRKEFYTIEVVDDNTFLLISDKFTHRISLEKNDTLIRKKRNRKKRKR
ncbi:hypothetical protein [Algivirga pacifica]|uniref:Uncharacterized protein n=1 Tax=Algivirga pacifica TaxID=1162670 RepID=A0ABP9D0T9_9BACT